MTRTQLRVPEESPPGFHAAPIEDMVAVGAVGSSSARVWIRCSDPEPLLIEHGPADGGPRAGREVGGPRRAETDYTQSVLLRELEPGRRYAFRVKHARGERTIGEGRFETAPRSVEDAPDRFSFAMMSCHQPFDSDGRVTRAAAAMLGAAESVMEEHAAKFLLTIGDQMYTDYPLRLSLLDPGYFRRAAPAGRTRLQDCSAEEVRALLHQRYRCFWSPHGWRRLHARYASYPMLDDHDLIDNWGSVPAHRTAEWREFERGARAAYFDYQGSRVSDLAEPGRDFDYTIEYGPVAIYLLDLRSNRLTSADEARLYSDEQEQRLVSFLERARDRHAVFIVLPVPAVHLPRWGARLARWLASGNEDFSDRWSTAGHVEDRDRLLVHVHRHARAHPQQRVLLLSGDIHIGCAHEIAWIDGTPALLQLVSSGITHKVAPATQIAAKLSILANQKVVTDGAELAAQVRLLPGIERRHRNPYTGLNLGLVEMERRPSGRFAFRYSIHGERRGRPVCVYRSAWL